MSGDSKATRLRRMGGARASERSLSGLSRQCQITASGIEASSRQMLRKARGKSGH